MPEGLTSIDDLKVVITAETEKLSAGLANAQQVVAQFSGGSTSALSLFDAGLAKAGEAVEAFKGRLGLWLVVAEQVAKLAGRVAEEGAKVGNALGETERVDALKAAVTDLGEAVSVGVSGAFKNATGSLLNYALGLSAAGDMSASTSVKLKSQFAELADAAEKALTYSAQGFRSLGGEDADGNVVKLGKQIEHLKEHMKDLARIRDDVKGQVSGGFFDFLSEGQVVRYNEQLAEMARRLDDLVAKRDELTAVSREGWGTLEVKNEFSEKAIEQLERQARALRQQAEAREMAAGAAAEYSARMAALNSIEDNKATPMASDRARIDAAAADIGRLRQREDDQKQAERDAREAEALGRRADQTIARLAQEVAAIDGKRRALLDTSTATAIQIEQERVMADLRAKGLGDDQAVITQAMALATARIEGARALDDIKRQLDSVRQAGDVVGRSLEGAFKKWTEGAKIDGRDMVRSLLADLAQLAFRQSVTSQIGGGLSSLVGGLSSTIFGGPRAEGGPVAAGTTYLVGEQGPELFTASNSGTIIPNGKLGQGGGQTIHVTINQPINAQGAYPESIEQIKQAMAQQNAMLPGRVLEVVGDARERGGLA